MQLINKKNIWTANEKKGLESIFIHKPCQSGAKNAKIAKLVDPGLYFQKGGGATDTRKALGINVETAETKIQCFFSVRSTFPTIWVPWRHFKRPNLAKLKEINPEVGVALIPAVRW
jgi:hypothetical protein